MDEPTAPIDLSILSFGELLEKANELADALRELHDWAEVSTHYRNAKQSRNAFATAIHLLKQIGK